MDQRDFGSGVCRVCTETGTRDPISEDVDLGGAASGIRPLVETTIKQIEVGDFNPHTGIRFPQNACVSCSHLGLCLNNEQLIAANLIRKAGASDVDWLDKLVD
jgi:hypothetical protein